MVAVWIAAGLFAVVAVAECIHHGYRLAKMRSLACPHCGTKYGLAVAWRSRQTVLHIQWEPDAKPRFGDLEYNHREYKCGSCGRYATMNLYGERDTLHELAEEEERRSA